MTAEQDDVSGETSPGAEEASGSESPPDAESPPENVFWQETRVDREDRERARGHRGACLWFTGLSASGKTTLATAVEERLHRAGYATFLLDGDNVRHGLNRDLGFSPEDRDENIRRVGEVARLFVEAGTFVTTSFISPYRDVRDAVRERFERPDDLVEIFVSCPLEVCEARDPKGLYEMAREGEIDDFTGVSAPYEEPLDPEIVVDTDAETPEACVDQIVAWLHDHGYVGADALRAARATGS